MTRIDERDVMFSRMTYRKGTEAYEDYYKRNPHKKDKDDILREPPHVLGEGTATYNPINSPIGEAAFRFLGDIKKFAEGRPNPNKVETDASIMTSKLKGLAKFYGASLVGITRMKEEFYYSHRGRDPKKYGEEVTELLPYGIVFAVEMQEDMIDRAPLLPEAIEVTKGYVNAAVIGMILSYYIRELGYEARNHMDGNYLLVAPLTAEAAGLGEIGRHGLLITKEFGPRVRLGVVTTDMELLPDTRLDLGIPEFCQLCENCTSTCPGKAIPKGNREDVQGIKRWKINDDDCFSVWKRVGTDCGVCLSACPFSHSVDIQAIENMKQQPELMEKILEEYRKKHQIRPFNKEPHDWL